MAAKTAIHAFRPNFYHSVLLHSNYNMLPGSAAQPRDARAECHKTAFVSRRNRAQNPPSRRNDLF
jgi:hypothetical protein